ncbi:phospholipase [Microbacterium sp. C7(2022)]|uniref:aggregation-promoting factor C-terminal-like domain-containing protein n=1 Tax=Microbacterium sp. C7(2022) TaxID=2992759 RepID=UPI00237C15B0|nr:phospholipase [Microbacterium sp. C7(2022)]MDE0546219.1 phospholipase [Microbacterium sp. C7(2022)]
MTHLTPAPESVLPSGDTRRARRAATRRTRATLAGAAVAASVALGATLLTGFASTMPASAAEPADISITPAMAVQFSATSPTLAAAAAGAQTLTDITDAAESALAQGQGALDAAEVVVGEVAASDLELEGSTRVDTSSLRAALDELAGSDVLPLLLLPDLTQAVTDAAADVTAKASALSDRLDAAEKKAAEEAAEARRKAEEEAKRQAAEAAAAAAAAANTPAGAQATAQQMSAEKYGWGAGQFSCLVSLWQKESGWNYQAYNSSSGATGIPQSLPGSKMASAGADWQTNATTQIAWGLDYISRAYGTPCAAWGHSQAVNWY